MTALKIEVVNGWTLPKASVLCDDLMDHWKAHTDGAFDARESGEDTSLPVRLQWDEDEGAFALRFDTTVESFEGRPVAFGEFDLAAVVVAEVLV